MLQLAGRTLSTGTLIRNIGPLFGHFGLETFARKILSFE